MDIIKNRRFQLIVGFVVVVVVIVMIGLLTSGGEEIDVLPEEGSSLDYSEQAKFVDSKDLAQNLGGVDQYDSLTKDLFVFAKKTFALYTTEPQRVVGFSILGDIEKEDSVVRFSGRFGAAKDKIDVVVNLLNNRRLKVSITNTKTNQNVDSELLSNSKINQFIGSLLFTNDLFKIEYNPSTNSFTITAHSKDPSVRKQATDYIVQESGKQPSEFKVLFKPFLF